jgi:hypothetical protein
LRKVTALVLLACAASLGAQAPSRIATTVEALIGSAVFFHGRSVVLQQKLITDRALTRLANAPKPVYVFWKDRAGGEEGEIRGEFWDLGRLEARDSRFTGYDLVQLVETVNRGQWPSRDQIYIITAASLQPVNIPKSPTLRAIALAPANYVDREVKVIGRFKGRNLYGDLPFAIAKSKWDFVMQSAEGALWVAAIRPKGKDFDLDPSKRVDTGRWVEVKGVVRLSGTTPYIEGSAIALAKAPEEAAVIELPRPPSQPPPSVIFSAPIQEDQGVDRTAPVRIQFSRDMDVRSLRDRIVVSYVAPAAGTPAVPSFTAAYNDVVHAVEIKFAQPLEGFQQVKVELREGITALDGQPLKPWTLTFTTGR